MWQNVQKLKSTEKSFDWGPHEYTLCSVTFTSREGSYKAFKGNNIEHEKIALYISRLGTTISSLVVKIVKTNSAVAKNHEKLMHLTELSNEFILGSESSCTEIFLKVCWVVKINIKKHSFNNITEDT